MRKKKQSISFKVHYELTRAYLFTIIMRLGEDDDSVSPARRLSYAPLQPTSQYI